MNDSFNSGGSVIVTFYKSSSANSLVGALSFGTTTVDVTHQFVKVTNICTIFNALTDFLIIECDISGNTLPATNGIVVGIGLY